MANNFTYSQDVIHLLLADWACGDTRGYPTANGFTDNLVSFGTFEKLMSLQMKSRRRRTWKEFSGCVRFESTSIYPQWACPQITYDR
jgi:hypothetical protein